MPQPALDLVIAALERIREKSGRAPRASRTALARLQAPPVAASLREACTSATERQLQAARNKADLLAAVRERVGACTKCAHLACSRTQTVFGVGNPDADLMFIGEAPGADEDQQGEPFVGRAGQLLTRILKAMNFAREDVYIANILKCRPDMPAGSFGNRPPTPTEMQTCRPYLAGTDRHHSAKCVGRAGRGRCRGVARNASGNARIAWPLAYLQQHSADDHVSPRVLAAKPGAFRKTQSLGRHASSHGAARATH